MAVGLLACTSNGNPSDGGTGANNCHITLSGALTGSFGCRDLSLFYNSEDNQFLFSLNNEDDAPLVTLTQWEGTGEPSALTYDGRADDAVKCSVTVKDGAKTWWVRDQISDPVGSCSLTFSSVSVDSSTATTKSYVYAGSFTAEAIANTLTGASGNVQFSATFEYH